MSGRVSVFCRLLLTFVSFVLPSASADRPRGAPPRAGGIWHGSGAFTEPATFLLSEPRTLEVATLGDEIDAADICDVESADFDGDGRYDLAVAWYATDLDDRYNNLRYLSIYFGCGTGSFVLGADYDLYIPSELLDALSVFRNGPGDIGLGDFDGDGDADLAVTPFYGDELWFLENLGDGSFEPHLKYPFGFNTTGNFLTPPEACAADFDDDGRDELVYIADPIQYIQGDTLHFWETDGSLAEMERVQWEGVGELAVQWTRGLAVADFDLDGQLDLCFSGSVNPPEEDDPVLVFWYDLDLDTRQFAVAYAYPNFLCSDVVAYQPDPAYPPGVLLTDLDGTRLEYWASESDDPLDLQLVAEESGYAGYAANRGMTAVTGDVDGDGVLDLVTRQKLGSLEQPRQIEVTLAGAQGQRWNRVAPNPLNTAGFQDLPYTEILRPRNLAVADFCGNTLPEVVAAFGPAPVEDSDGEEVVQLRVALWHNSCIGDVTRDGRTDVADLCALLCEMAPGDRLPFDPDADLDKDGQIGLGDLSILLSSYGCDCREDSMPPPACD